MALSATRGVPSPGLSADPSHFASLRGRGGFFHLLPQQSWGRSSERQRDREGAGERRVAGVVGTALSTTRGRPSPGLTADPSHSASLRGRGGYKKPPLPAKLGEVERAKQAREGAGEQRGEGVIGTALSATRGGLSPGLRPTPPTPLRCVGGEVCKNLLSQQSWGRSIERSKIGRGPVNRGLRVLLGRR